MEKCNSRNKWAYKNKPTKKLDNYLIHQTVVKFFYILYYSLKEN